MSLELDEYLLEFVRRRGRASSCCPSEVARGWAEGRGEAWRPWMEPVRQAAARLELEGLVQVLQRGELASRPWRGPIRLRWSGKEFPL